MHLPYFRGFNLSCFLFIDHFDFRTEIFFGDFIFLFVVLFNQDSFIEASFFWRGWDEGGVGTVD